VHGMQALMARHLEMRAGLEAARVKVLVASVMQPMAE